MNQEERDWLEWLKRVQDGVVTQWQADAKLGVSDRWVRKLLARMKTDGDVVVVHGLRGRSSNHRIDEQTHARVVELLKQPEWYDFGPTFASQQLAKRYGIDVSKETVRGWMVAAGLWNRLHAPVLPTPDGWSWPVDPPGRDGVRSYRVFRHDDDAALRHFARVESGDCRSGELPEIANGRRGPAAGP